MFTYNIYFVYIYKIYILYIYKQKSMYQTIYKVYIWFCLVTKAYIRRLLHISGNKSMEAQMAYHLSHKHNWEVCPH